MLARLIGNVSLDEKILRDVLLESASGLIAKGNADSEGPVRLWSCSSSWTSSERDE